MIQALLLDMPTWQIIRVLGLASYSLLFMGVSLGLIYSMPFLKGKRKALVYKWHSTATNAGLILILGHIIFLLIDTYVPFTWKGIAIPFSAGKDPIWNGLGTIAFYGVVLVIVTTDFKAFMSNGLWRSIHMLAYPVFLLAMVHGLGSGTDSRNVWIFGWYVTTCLIVTLLIVLRVFLRSREGVPINSHTKER
ncbi:ferric reductase [Paenibacillus sp. sptzw28]|uniref:ferric reductase n=1 Tax=Paenibacillus sp. sptzw28 TaxID=715179 RepID=UPI001C6EB8D7|nr:ferric reductase [Paenibacillus sp. sptzw28]QYR22726.1 ferric reductase [Paenibacillus sp. sptzw28]